MPPGKGAMTLTFLFADIRDYTSFVERHGDDSAGRLIIDFRRLVRAQLARTGGGEVKTEGDSFYLVFRTAGQALRCGAGILQQAERRGAGDRPLRVGVGIHAGEPVPVEGQYVGSAVNLAARVGAAAEAGELLITDTVRGLLRTSGLPPVTERSGLPLKGIEDAPRVYSVDWRQMEVPSATERRTRTVSGRWVLPAALAAAGVVGAMSLVIGPAIVGRPGATAPQGPTPSSSTVPHGVLLFEADLTPAGSGRALASTGDSRDRVRFTGDAIRFEVTTASWAAITVANLAPDDFLCEFAVRPVRGEGTIAFFFRGSSGRQDQVVVVPTTGELVIQVTRSFEADTAPQRLFGPASRVPATRDQPRELGVSARGRDIVVYLAGSEIARAVDPVIASGSIGFVANAARNQELVIDLTSLRLYNP